MTEQIDRDTDGKVQVNAMIIVERKSQKGIIIGKGGKMIKDIGIRARKDIERLLGDDIHLELWVKVQKDWREKPARLNEYGYRRDDY